MPKIDISKVTVRKGCPYPPPFDAPCAERTRRRLGDAGGLHDFGVNLIVPRFRGDHQKVDNTKLEVGSVRA